MAGSAVKGRGHNPPQEPTINAIQSTGHPMVSMQRAVPVSEVAGNSKGWLAELVEGNCERRTGPMHIAVHGATPSYGVIELEQDFAGLLSNPL